jgi:ABC-type multidrug transport system fused ATPase/permease subunit
MIVNATVETAGVASVLPFLAVLGNPGVVESNSALRWVFDALEFDSVDRFLLFLGVSSLVAVMGSAIIRVITEYGLVRFVELRRHSLSYRLLERYLRQPYPFFVNRNSAHLSKAILSEVDHVVGSVFLPALGIPAYGFVTLGLVTLLIVVDPVVAVVVALVVGAAYGGLYLAVLRTIRRRGTDRVEANRARFATAAEVFGGIKEVKLLGREDAYLRRFRDPSLRFSQHQAVVRTVSVIPRYLIEAIGFGAILALAISMIAVGDDLGKVLPVLGLYAFAGYRLLPAVQNLYASFANLRFGIPATEALYDDLQGLAGGAAATTHGAERITLDQTISWRSVTFHYPEAREAALEDVTLDIPARSIVAFVGETGAGKTTAVDLILGLLSPTEGEILIDGTPLEDRVLRSWQNSIGYVPQHIYLADDTVLANIAFGVPAAEIDEAAAERAARLARLHDFISNRLPRGYRTIVGERGVRLSGGQRQRLGIARALYNDPSVLVFDEATSAVDTITEQEVMSALHSLAPNKTLILVAHRLSTVREANPIFLLDHGRLVAVGDFDELVEGSSRFRGLAAGIGS